MVLHGADGVESHFLRQSVSDSYRRSERRTACCQDRVSWRLLRDRQDHALRFEKFVNSFYSVFAADARDLHSAEWHHETVRPVCINPDRSDLEGLCHARIARPMFPVQTSAT